MAHKRRRHRNLGGRPPLPAEARQDAALILRFRPDELDELRALAAQAGLGPGVYAREVVRRHVARKRRR